MRSDEEIKTNNGFILPNIWCIGSMRYAAAAEQLADALLTSAEGVGDGDGDTICRRGEVGRAGTCLGFLGNYSGNVPWEDGAGNWNVFYSKPEPERGCKLHEQCGALSSACVEPLQQW